MGYKRVDSTQAEREGLPRYVERFGRSALFLHGADLDQLPDSLRKKERDENGEVKTDINGDPVVDQDAEEPVKRYSPFFDSQDALEAWAESHGIAAFEIDGEMAELT